MYKTALVHDWLNTMAGAEKVLEAIYEVFPSPIYTVVANKDNMRGFAFQEAPITTSFIQKMPFGLKHYRRYLPLMPLAVEQFDMSGYDIVISSSHAVAKGVITSANQLHISYIHTPIRYAWDLQPLYLKESGLHRGLKGLAAKVILHYIRQWDRSNSLGVDYFIANSHYIARRIKKTYRREAEVIYPPVDVNTFKVSTSRENYFLTASRMVPYKKIDLIAEAFSQMPQERIIIIGDGPDFKKVRAKSGKNVELLQWQPKDRLKEYMQRARAFIFAAEEDFGILPVEAQACGCPVIAYGKGGVTETVIDNRTGIFFQEQTVESLKDALKRFQAIENSLDRDSIRKQAELFSTERFKRQFKSFIENKAEEFFKQSKKI